MMTERSGRVLFLAAGALTVNSTQVEFMQQNVHKQETYGIMKAKQSGFSYTLHLYIFFLSPLISQCASWRRDLWGTVYDIRLRISDSMMLIIRLQATKKRREEGEIKRYMGSRTETEMDGE